MVTFEERRDLEIGAAAPSSGAQQDDVVPGTDTANTSNSNKNKEDDDMMDSDNSSMRSSSRRSMPAKRLSASMGTLETFTSAAGEIREKKKQISYEPTDRWWSPPLKAWIPETNLGIIAGFVMYNVGLTLLGAFTSFCGTATSNAGEQSFCDEDFVLLHDKALTGLTVGMFLLLAFRVNQAYDRFWEGRKMWGRLREVCRDFTRLVCFHIRCTSSWDIKQRRRAVDFVTAFCVALKLHLRKERHILRDLTTGKIADQVTTLSYQDVANIQQQRHMPLFCQDVLSDYLAKQVAAGNLSDYQLGVINTSTLAVMSDTMGSCERIRNTPIPLSYVLQLRYLLIIWLLIYPLHLVAYYDWWTILLASIVDIAVLGIESMACIIENPFGYDRNDLDLDDMCNGICQDIHDILDRTESSSNNRVVGLFDRSESTVAATKGAEWNMSVSGEFSIRHISELGKTKK